VKINTGITQQKNGTAKLPFQASLCLALFLGMNILQPGFSQNKVQRLKENVLFAFDDYSIPFKHNLKLTLVQADKYPGNPVLRRGVEGSPDFGHAVLYGTVIKTGKKFRMWYLGMIEGDYKKAYTPGWYRPMLYAESTDGIHWVKPELGLVDLNGNKKNNICLIEGDPHVLTLINDFLSVLYDPEDPDPSRRYKLAYINIMSYDEINGGLSNVGKREKRPATSVMATSADGLRWKIVGDRPFDAGGERFEVSGLYRFGKFYYATGQLLNPWTWRPDGTNVGRVMMGYRSPDFIHWQKAKSLSLIRAGQLTNPPVKGQQMHMGAGMWNRGNVMVGIYGQWQDAAVTPPKGESNVYGVRIDLGLCISNDGIHFREPVPDFKIIPHGTGDDWDNHAVLQGHAFVNEGDKTMIWYSHWDTDMKMKGMDIGLATLRRDGFGYLSLQYPGNDAEFITTTTTTGQYSKLLINVDSIAAEAPLKVELLDDFDRPVAGYSGANAATIVANGTQKEIIWPKTKSALLPANKPLAVRLLFPTGSKAKVYALYFRNS
jgi:hypothetical protein